VAKAAIVVGAAAVTGGTAAAVAAAKIQAKEMIKKKLMEEAKKRALKVINKKLQRFKTNKGQTESGEAKKTDNENQAEDDCYSVDRTHLEKLGKCAGRSSFLRKKGFQIKIVFELVNGEPKLTVIPTLKYK